MRSIWQSLAWKEWHEHKWKFAALTTVLCGVNALLLLNGPLVQKDSFESTYALTAFCVIPLAMFIGAGVAAGERSRGTAQFLQAMPVSKQAVATFKLLAGLATVVVSIALALLFVYVGYYCWSVMGYDVETGLNRAWIIFPRPIELQNSFVECALVLSLIAGSVFLWTVAAGINRQDEVSAAARAVLIMFGWWIVIVCAGSYLGPKWLRTDGYWFATTFLAASPGGVSTIYPPASWRPPPTLFGVALPIIVGVVVHFVLALWFIFRYGRSATDRVRSARSAVSPAGQIDWLGPPRRSPLAAIMWKQCRESGSVVLAGVAGILAIVTVVAVVHWREVGPEEVLKLYTGVTVVLGLFITLVVGIGVMHFDVGPQLNTFWRSRPISPDLWFWAKFFTGLLVLFVSLYLPLVAFAFLVGTDESWREFWASDTIAFPAITIAIYIAAVTMTCLVRHAVYAAILSIATLYVGPLLVLAGAAAVNWLIWRKEPKLLFESESGWWMAAAVAAAMCAVAVGVLILGWLAVRYDWGRKSRY